MRIVIAEDSVLLREGLVRLLSEEGHEVVAQVGDGEALVAAVTEHRPDVAVVDVRMPPTHTDEGLRAALRLRQERPGTGVLVLSRYVEEHYAADLLSSGAEGVDYLLKDRVAHVEEFVAALERVRAGGTALDPEVVRQILVRSRRTDPIAGLTERERTVLENMAEGHNNRSIAALLHISESAVEKHINTIFTKLDLHPAQGYHRRVLAVLHYLRS